MLARRSTELVKTKSATMFLNDDRMRKMLLIQSDFGNQLVIFVRSPEGVSQSCGGIKSFDSKQQWQTFVLENK